MPSPLTSIPRSRWNTNSANRFRYGLWAWCYDAFTHRFAPHRKRSIQQLPLHPGNRVLIIGAGTGLDLPYVPANVRVVATDLTSAMLHRLARRVGPGPGQHPATLAAVMDGQRLALPDASVDAVILHLILAVIPDPARCALETARVLRPGGYVAVMDKFLAEAKAPPLWLRMLTPIGGLVGTELTRRLGPILQDTGLRIVVDQPAGMGGYFRMVLLRKDQH